MNDRRDYPMNKYITERRVNYFIDEHQGKVKVVEGAPATSLEQS